MVNNLTKSKLLLKSIVKFINLVKLPILDLFRLLVLTIININGVLDNATDDFVGGSLAPWYFIKELFWLKYKRIPFTNTVND